MVGGLALIALGIGIIIGSTGGDGKQSRLPGEKASGRTESVYKQNEGTQMFMLLTMFIILYISSLSECYYINPADSCIDIAESPNELVRKFVSVLFLQIHFFFR